MRNTSYHIRKEYSERQGLYSGYHRLFVELVRLQVSNIGDNKAIDCQIYDSDHYNGYEYQQHPEDDTVNRRVRNKPADVCDIMTQADHAHNEIQESLPQIHEELYGIGRYLWCSNNLWGGYNSTIKQDYCDLHLARVN